MATIGLNVAQIKDRAREKGINLTEQQAQEILKQAWNQSMWGADPAKVESILSGYRSGGGTTTIPLTSTTGGDMTSRYADIVANLKNLFSGATSKYEEALKGITEKITQQSQKAQQQKLELIPIVQNIYSKLAEDLARTFEAEKAAKEKEKTIETGKQAQAAAAAGFSTLEGFDAAMIRSLQEDYDRQISNISDRYRISREKLAAEEAKDIKALEAEAAEAEAAGLRDIANINLKLIDLKQQEDNLIRQAAANILQAETQQEKNYYQNLYREALLDLKERSLELAAQKAQLSEASSALALEKLLMQQETTGLQNLQRRAELIGQIDLGKLTQTALSALEAVDTNKDRMVSRDEFLRAYQTVLNKVRGDVVLAQEVMTRAFNAGGFRKWRW